MYYLRNFDKQADAIGQKAYLPTIAIVGGVNKVGYFDGDASKDNVFSEDGDFIKIGEAKETRLVCTYNVTSITEATQIYYKTSGFTSMEVDGTEVTLATGYTFDTIGEHTVKYTLKDNTTIGSNAFYNCKGLTSITIPDSVTSIGQEAFQYCSGLTSVVIPNSVTNIGNYAFACCTGLTSVTISSGVTTTGDYTFWGCTSLSSIKIPNSVTSIGSNAFCDCSNLSSLTIGSGLTSIGIQAFYRCLRLTSITIPSGVTHIGCAAFQYCSNLSSIYYKGTVAQWKAITREDYWHSGVTASEVTCFGDWSTCGLDATA